MHSSNTASLPLMLKQLKLPAMQRACEELGEKSLKEHWSPKQYLAELCHLELLNREDKRLNRYLKESKLPTGKNLASFDFQAVEGLNQPLIHRLIERPDWLKQGNNILMFGASGLGKTHLASSLGYSLIEKGFRVRFFTAMELVQLLQEAKLELKLQNELKKLDKYHLLIIDDVGYVKKSEQETSVLFELIAYRYERHSLAITSNKSFEDWDELFDDTIMTVAAIDRLVHHAEIIQFTGESYRRKQALNK